MNKPIRGQPTRLVLLWLALVAWFLPACGKISGSLEHLNPNWKTHDFLNTEILSSGSAFADGVSGLTIAIQLKDSDNSPVGSYKPTYKIVAGLGVTPNECTSSLDNGISYCILQATVPGQKTMELTNAKVGLQKNLQFDPKGASSNVMQLTSSSQQDATTADGYKVSSSAGHATKEIKVGTADGYSIFVHGQGILNSSSQ